MKSPHIQRENKEIYKAFNTDPKSHAPVNTFIQVRYWTAETLTKKTRVI